MSSSTTALRDLLAGPPFIAADCYSALTARVVERAGFGAAYMGGHATGMMHYAVPDSGLLTTTEMIEQAARVASAVSIPVIVDADQAGESVANVVRTIRAFERAGVAGVHIEDEINPKHSSFDGPLLAIEEMQTRLAAAVAARTDPGFVIIARCDELHAEGGGGSARSRRRSAGASPTPRPGPTCSSRPWRLRRPSPQVAEAVPVPLAAYGALHPGVTLSLSTGWGTAGAVRAHAEMAAHLLAHGDVPAEAFELPDKEALIDQEFYDDVVRTWARRTGRPVTGNA